MEAQDLGIVVTIVIPQDCSTKHLKWQNHLHLSSHQGGLLGKDLVLILEFPRTLGQDLVIFLTMGLELRRNLVLTIIC